MLKNNVIKNFSKRGVAFFLALTMVFTGIDFSIIADKNEVKAASNQLVKSFGYTGGVQSYTLNPGSYIIEAYGAQGGSTADVGGKGGKAVGTLNVSSSTTIYVVVGGQGSSYSGGYNGGGYSAGAGGGGGGATHVATTNRGALSNYASYKSEILLVAGGGGGDAGRSGRPGGAGGGANQSGSDGYSGCGGKGYGGTTSAAGASGKNGSAAGFGYGGNQTVNESNGGAGGGGGYYGGGAGGNDGPPAGKYHDNDDSAGGGGSGYADTSKLTNISGTSGVQSGNGAVNIYLAEGKSTINTLTTSVGSQSALDSYWIDWKAGLIGENGTYDGKIMAVLTGTLYNGESFSRTATSTSLSSSVSGRLPGLKPGTYSLTVYTTSSAASSTQGAYSSKTSRVTINPPTLGFTQADNLYYSVAGDFDVSEVVFLDNNPAFSGTVPTYYYSIDSGAYKTFNGTSGATISGVSGGMHTFNFKWVLNDSKGAKVNEGISTTNFILGSAPVISGSLETNKIAWQDDIVIKNFSVTDADTSYSQDIKNTFNIPAQSFSGYYSITDSKGTSYAHGRTSFLDKAIDKVPNEIRIDSQGLDAGSYTLKFDVTDINNGANNTGSKTFDFIIREDPIVTALVSDNVDSEKKSSLTTLDSNASVYVSGTVNNKNKLKGNIYYKVGNSAEKVLKAISTTDTTFANTIPMSELSHNDNEIYIYARDEEGYESDKIKLNVYKNKKPDVNESISITAKIVGADISDVSYSNGIRVTDKTDLSISGKVKDLNGNGLSVSFFIKDSKGNVVTNNVLKNDNAITSFEATSPDTWVDFSGTIENSKFNLASGQYKLCIKVVDDKGASHIEEYNLSINYKPSIESSALAVRNASNNNAYVDINKDSYVNKGAKIYLHGTFSDSDKDGVRLLYRIDNSGSWKNGVDGINGLFTNNSTNAKAFDSCSISTNDLSEGKHTIYYKIVDTFGQESSTKSIEFNVNKHPIISEVNITRTEKDIPVDYSVSKTYSKVNEGESFWLYGRVSDADGHNMSIEYSIDNKDNYTKLCDVTTNGTSLTNFKGQVSTNGLSQGYHNIYVRVYDALRGTYYDCGDISVYNYDDSNKALNEGLHINYQPRINTSFVGNKQDTMNVSVNGNLKISNKGIIYLTGEVYDFEGDDVTLNYEFTKDGASKKTGTLTKVVLTNKQTSGRFNATIDNNSLNLESGFYTLTITPTDAFSKAGDSISYTVYINAKPQVSELKLTLDSVWNGALYKGATNTQHGTLSFKIKDVDSLKTSPSWINDDLTYSIKIDGKEIYKVKYTAKELVAKNGEVSISLATIQDYLANVSVSNQSEISVEVTDSYNDKTTSSIFKDVNGKIISIQENTAPDISFFNLEMDAITGNSIFDMLMTGQTKKPTFKWIATDENIGDYITKFDLYYSIDNGKTWSIIQDDIDKNISSYEWLNNTSYSKKNVCFRIVATDRFGKTSEKTYGVNGYLQLEKEVVPTSPASITSNTTKITYFVDENYLFSWSAATDVNNYDEIVEYVFGYSDNGAITDYDNMTVFYRGKNTSCSEPFNYKSLITSGNENITFGVYAIDKFGKKSSITTLAVSFFENHAPNKVDFSKDNFYNTETNDKLTTYIIPGETYNIKWSDAGDIDEDDYISYWTIYYKNSKVSNDWKILAQTRRTESTFVLQDGETIFDDITGTIDFKIVAFDKYDLNSEDSKIVTIDYVNDKIGPEVTSTLGRVDSNGQEVSFEITDSSEIQKVIVSFAGKDDVIFDKDGSVTNEDVTNAGYAYNSSSKKYVLKLKNFEATRNGNYTITSIDKWGNESTEILNISTIDSMAPTINVVPAMTNDDLTNKAFNITITVMDNVEVSSLFIKGNNINKSVAINNKTGSTTIRVDENCALEITAIDSVGNKAVETYEVTNIYKATSNITDNYVGLVNGDISEYAIGSTTFTVSSDIKNDKYLNLGSWKIESTQREVSSVVSNSGTSIEVTVYENGTYNFTFTDIWGNVSGPYSVTVNNVLSEELNYKLLYLVPLDEYKAKNIVGDVQNVVTVDTVKYRNELINKGYSDYNKFVPIEKSIQNSEKYENVFAYMELLEDSRFVYNFEDYTKTGYEIFKDDITGNDTKVLFKFSSEKNKVSFYYRNVNNTLASVKASFDVNSNDKVPVISTLLETSEVTNEDVRVIVKVADGYFFDNKEYYQYSEDGVVKNYYDEFKWISSESTFDNIVYLDEDTYADETNRKAFVITFKKNATVRIWAKNNNDDFVSKLVNVGNIDKENPIVTVSSYDDKFVYDKLTIEAYTNEIFLSANDLVELLKTLYPDRIEAIDSLDIPNNYTISNNKHYAYMTFKANTTDETRDLFKFYACDYASNFGSSEFININNFYSASENTQFIYAYLDESETFVTITKEELYDMRTNKNITIQVTTKDANGVLYQGGQFFSSNNPNCDVDEPYSLTQVISESGIYTYCVIDSYGNKVYDALDLTDVINKEIPELTYNVTKNTNGQPTTQNIDYTISSNKIGKFEIKNKNGNMIYSSETNETSISFNLSQNGKYSVLFTDIYGNEVWDIIEVTDIYGTAYSPTITVSGIRNTATNENVNVLANVENGNFTDVLYLDNGEYISLIDSNGFKTHEAIEISTTEKGLAFVFKDNLTIKVVAKNYYGNGEVSEEISISCIDKTKPNNANVQYNVSKDGFIEINFIDTGDDGFGSKEVYYTISQPTALDSRQGSTRLNQAVTFSDISATKVPNKNTSFNWKDSQWSDTNSDGKVSEDEVTNSFTLTYYVVDYAGNRSDVSEITIYIDNTSVNEFMSLYRDLTSRLTTIKAIKDDTERQTQLEGFVSENSFFLDAYEEEIENYANTMQKTFVQDKIKTLRMLMSSSTNSSDEVIALINEYFNRLSQDITDNGFMDELQVLINSLDDKSKRESYQSRYDYYKNKIDGLFVDSTSVEFNYTDDKGNWLNPLSGYVVYSTKTGKIYGTYNSNGEFEKGEVNRNYYFTSNGTKINLDITGNTYVDGNGNTVSTIDGLISPNAGYYDNKGEIVQHRPAKGFYDFQGKWHSREGLKEVKDPTTGETGEGGESGNDNPGTGDDPSVNPNPNQGDTKVYPTSITLAKQELTMYVGDVYLMSYTLAPSNVTEKDITWTSTNSKVVRVTNGYIIANGEGTGDIIAKTSNGLSAIVSVTVDKASSANVDNEPEQVTSVSSKLPKYPTIDETYPNKPSEEESGSGVAKYTHQKIGSTNYAAMTLNDAMTNDFRVIYGDGYDDIFISDATNVGSGVIEKASKNNLSITIGNDSTRLTLSNTDNVGRISTFGLSGNSGNATVSINGQNNLGNSSKLTLVGAPDKVVYYNGNIVSSIYDNSEGAYIVTNPMNGTYSIGDRPTSIYTDLDNYDITVDTTGKLSYADVIVACYNCLQSDNFGQLFSNIEESSSVYRQASVLQKHGILGSNPNISTFDNISGKEAYDMLYQTLANKTSEDLNYEPELFSQSSITLDDLNNMVRNITVINY